MDNFDKKLFDTVTNFGPKSIKIIKTKIRYEVFLVFFII